MQKKPSLIPIGKAEILAEGGDLAIIAIGSMVYPALLAQRELSALQLKVKLINARFAKPLDEDLIVKTAQECNVILTVEENTCIGGLGGAVLELLSRKGIQDAIVQTLALPDQFIEAGNLGLLRDKYKLSSSGITQAAREAYRAYLDKSTPQVPIK